MGLCATKSATAEDVTNKDIDKVMGSAKKVQDEIIKLLLLGAGESGKSTIFKQMKILYGRAYDEEELRNLVPVVHNNVLQNFILVLENCNIKNITVEAKAEFDKFMDDYNEDSKLDKTVGKLLKALWADPGVQSCWEERSTYQVLDSLSYYCLPENIDRIEADDYLPTMMDILQARVRTSGIVEEKYLIDDVNFTMFDVGGQRNERKKWIHCFDGVTAVIFVAAINEYDQVLYEDNRTKRMDEAIKLFDEICNSQWFGKTAMILFLNKSDLFQEKLFRIPYKVAGERNDDFEGPDAMEDGVDKEVAIQAATAHTLAKFIAVKRDEAKEIYHHVTCATDTNNVEVVFNACKDIILRDNLVSSGFMS